MIEIFISFLSLFTSFYSFFTGYTLSSQKFHVTEGTEWTKEDMGWANIEARDTNAMDIPQVPHLVTAVATTGGGVSASASSSASGGSQDEEWVVVATAGVCSQSGMNSDQGCPQKIIQGTTFPWKTWEKEYNAGYRLTSMAVSNSTGWVLVLHQNSGIGLQKINILERDILPNKNIILPGWTISSLAGNFEGWHVVYSQPSRFGPPCLKICANDGMLNENTCTCTCKFPWFGDTKKGKLSGVGCQRRPEPCILKEFGAYDDKCPVACDGDFRRRRREIVRQPSVAPEEEVDGDSTKYNGESCAIVNCKMNRNSFVDRKNVLGKICLIFFFIIFSLVVSEETNNRQI